MNIGYNYHPSIQGCHYWKIWDFDEIEADLRKMSEEGYQIVRFFIFWRDFEPEEGRFEPASFARLRQFVETADRYGLLCIPAILTIWMNGQLFDLPWRMGRSLWTDSTMLTRQERFIGRVVTELAGFENIMAYDLGDEIVYIDFERETIHLEPEEVEHWLLRMSQAVKMADPSARVVMGNDHLSLIGRHHFSAEAIARHTDMLAVHGFPLWTPFLIESNESWKASLYVPYLVKLAQLYHSEVIVDEFGLYGASDEKRAEYVRISGLSSYLHGAKGIVSWCWKDFSNQDKPYAMRPGERFVGFYDQYGQRKAGADAFLEVAKLARDLSFAVRPKSEVAIYVSEKFRDGNVNELDTPQGNSSALFHSFLLLTRLQVRHEFISTELERYKVVIVPAPHHLTGTDLERLRNYVIQGGIVLYTPGSYLHGFGGQDLFGVELDDYTLFPEQQAEFEWKDLIFRMDWKEAGFNQIPVIRETKAEVLARFSNSGVPALTMNSYGEGHAFYLNAPMERILHVPGRMEETNYGHIYRNILSFAGVISLPSFSSPAIEIHTLVSGAKESCILLNHSPAEQTGVLALPDGTRQELRLAGKSILYYEY
ncbi:beta-galactosidase trimerization domain-containing protein [Paenibacillus sp.]|jgi:endo-1,4-beta-mannosidase|uniref:beta-galactosidase trimerization domain-containing protein n=1 Tax=Paenibacillus sp. TaxID=58172 RepID=UPI00281CF147|nr:beta-galactosidase trimerization domain-containing protein [Paenibacillus sp.]MDR0267483.1 beta-galactosidase trimerization domain-containing protein [Paenibacillus sp.]